MKDFAIFSGSSNIPLATAVAKNLGIPLGNVALERFADGELRPWVNEDVRDKTVFVIESLSYPMDEHVMEVVLMGDAIRRSAPKTMIAVIPYMGYARQDKQHRVGEPVSARVIAKILEVSKYKEVITIDLHNDAIVGFFQVPVTHLTALSPLANEIKSLQLKNMMVVSPDVGGVKRARNLAYQLDVDMIVMEKKRYIDRHDTSENFQIIGDVKGKDAVVIDDIISTGGTIASAVRDLKAEGTSSVTVCATHGVFAGKAMEILTSAPIDHLFVTDTILGASSIKLPNMKVVSVAPLISDAITTIIR
jgi:ribose-phosphate pyrophosphokinase